MSTLTVSAALENLQAAIRQSEREALIQAVSARLDRVAVFRNGHAPKPERRRVSSAGRARQIKAMKAYWRAKRAAKAKAKK